MSMKQHDQSGIYGQNLTVGYQQSAPPVIENQSLRIITGKINILIGPNGSGKSTLMKALARQLKLTAGNILVDGKELRSMNNLELAAKIGILFQENFAPNDLTVEELVYYSRYPRLRMFESLTAADHAAVEKALQMTGTAIIRSRKICALSSGQRQLVWIALLLAQSSTYLFLDEPTTFLDLANQLEILDCIRRLNRELDCTIVISLHDLNMAAQYADYIFALREGKIVVSGTPEEVITPGTLKDVFSVNAKVILDEDGYVYCIPKGFHKGEKPIHPELKIK